MSPMHPVTVPAAKATNEFRVLCAGASALKGFPQPMGLAAPAFLQTLLSEACPERDVRVVNLGATALASFPVRDLAAEAVDALQPDLLIVYAGHNEFFGAFGVAEHRVWNRTPRLQALYLSLRGLGIVEAAGHLLAGRDRTLDNRQLMDVLGDQKPVPPDSPLRARAARNLRHHVAALANHAAAEGIPVVVCSLPVNERGLAPIGPDPDFDAWAQRNAWMEKLDQDRIAPDDLPSLEAWVDAHPASAMGFFLLARALEAAGQSAEAARRYRAAVDADTMPWRATSIQQEALREAAEASGAVFCDVRDAVGPAPGWDWFDDHVHLTLEGQARLARIWFDTLAAHGLAGPLSFSTDNLPDTAHLLIQHGDNRYDRAAVAVMMASIFEIPFMQRNNAAARERMLAQRDTLLDRIPTGHRAPFLLWCRAPATSLGRKPVTLPMALESIRAGKPLEADGLLDAALRSTPPYSSWYLETVYFRLANRRTNLGGWTAEDRALAEQAATQAEVLIAQGVLASGQAEGFGGRIYQLLGNHARAIELLTAARPKLNPVERIGADIALLASYRETGDRDAANAVLEEGMRNPQTRTLYRKMQPPPGE